MEQNIESLPTQDNFSLNHDAMTGECESVFGSNGKHNCQNSEFQFDSEAVASEINDILLEFATTSQRTDEIESQLDTGIVRFDDVSASGHIFEGEFGPGNELVCLPANLTNTNQQLTVTCSQNQSGWIDCGVNDQEYFNLSDVQQQNRTNSDTFEPINLLRLTQSNGDKVHSVEIHQLECPEKQSKTTKDVKKTKVVFFFFLTKKASFISMT